jgi:hypothetical protein
MILLTLSAAVALALGAMARGAREAIVTSLTSV